MDILVSSAPVTQCEWFSKSTLSTLYSYLEVHSWSRYMIRESIADKCDLDHIVPLALFLTVT